jgi:hypothetical protein
MHHLSNMQVFKAVGIKIMQSWSGSKQEYVKYYDEGCQGGAHLIRD